MSGFHRHLLFSFLALALPDRFHRRISTTPPPQFPTVLTDTSEGFAWRWRYLSAVQENFSFWIPMGVATINRIRTQCKKGAIFHEFCHLFLTVGSNSLFFTVSLCFITISKFHIPSSMWLRNKTQNLTRSVFEKISSLNSNLSQNFVLFWTRKETHLGQAINKRLKRVYTFFRFKNFPVSWLVLHNISTQNLRKVIYNE